MTRTQRDIVDLIESQGVRLKKTGKEWVGFCPFHHDVKRPSLSVNREKGVFHCFGCLKGGTAKQFLELLGKAPEPTNQDRRKTSSAFSPTESAALLQRAVAFYHRRFLESSNAKDYLKSRGLGNSDLISTFQIGFADGKLLSSLNAGSKKALREAGLLSAKNRELMRGCVTVPILDENGIVTELYGRSAESSSRLPHRYLPGPHKGVLNHKAVKTSKEIVLAECIIDAMTLWVNGTKNVIAAYGAGGFTEEMAKLLAANQTEKLYVAYDADEGGERGAEKVIERIQTHAPACEVLRVALPAGEDLNDYFQKGNTAEHFTALLNEAETIRKPSGNETLNASAVPQGLDLSIGDRRYRIQGIPKSLSASLRVNIRARKNGDLLMDTVDLYLARPRQFLSEKIAQLFGVKENTAQSDLLSVITAIESHQADGAERKKEEPEPMSEAEKAEALEYLRNPNLMENIITDLNTIGLVGETVNKQLAYLIAVSRKLPKPLHGVVLSRAAAGKSTLMEKVADLCPPEDVIRYSRITAQALFYKEQSSIKHKLLVIEEQEGATGADYALRILQSGQDLIMGAPMKNPATGAMETTEIKVEGPAATLFSGTGPSIFYDNATRVLQISADESTEQTERIHDAQRHSRTLEGRFRKRKASSIYRVHRNAQRLLRPIEVVNSFAPQLTFPADLLATRREQEKYLSLMDAITFLHQHQRERKTAKRAGERLEYIETTREDIGMANVLISAVLGQTLGELSMPSEKLLEFIERMVKKMSRDKQTPSKQINWSRRDIREYTRWSDHQIRTHLDQLEDLEYVSVVSGKKGKRYLYELTYRPRFSTDPATNGLMDPRKLVSPNKIKKNRKTL